MFPSLIRAIITDKASLNKCWADDNCIKAPVNPLGPPIQDLHEVSLNGAPAHPFGPEWMLTGEGLGSKEELWYWLERDWKKLAEDKLEKNPGLGNVVRSPSYTRYPPLVRPLFADIQARSMSALAELFLVTTVT